MNITIINYRPNGSDYVRGCLMDSTDSEHDIAYFSTDELTMEELIENSARFIANIIFNANKAVVNQEYAYYEDETTILFDGIEADQPSPNVALEYSIKKRAEEISQKMIIESKNNAIKQKQRADDLKIENEKAFRKEKYEKLKEEFGD